ncbi:flavin reductase family protein [Nocardia tengchongensis]|uniref:flavin reductase family protein n=1 Tax=Nocardia tengchongensis TaxID=2055889 RepID=UPI00340ABF57
MTVSEHNPTTEVSFDELVGRANPSMWIVTTVAGDRRAGCVVGFATQTSIDPRRFLVCLSKANFTYRVAERARHLAVHLLTTDTASLAELFGSETGSRIDKFEHCAWHEGPHSLPILTATTGWLTGEILQRNDFGDHVGYLLIPTFAHAPPVRTAPLRYKTVAGLPTGH